MNEPIIGGNSNKYLQAIIDSLDDELMVIDKDYRIVQVNEVVQKRHTKRRQEIIGEYCYNVAHGLPELCHSPHHECPIRTVWETGKPARVTHLHVYHVQNEKRERYLDIIASPVKDGHGNVIAVTELMRDVTETKQMELKIAKAHADLSALNAIANVVTQSLDLDTVLNSALDKTLEIMQRSMGGILLLDKEGQMLCYRVYRGLSDRYAKELCLKVGEGIAGRVAQTGESILVEDVATDPRAAQLDLLATEGVQTFVSVPLRSKEQVLGVLNIASHEASKLSPEDIRLLDGVATQIAIAIENAKLHQEVQRKDEIRGELLQDVFSIQEEERRRIARELHDETSQVIASLAANLEVVADTLPDGTDESKLILRKAQALSINILDEIHKLIYELRPTVLDDLGLVSAIRWLLDNNLKAIGITVNFKTAGRERRLTGQLEATLFRVIQEAVYNIAHHAQAKNTSVSLHFKKSTIKVRVRDNGIGFDVEEALSSKDRPRGLGLIGMKERVELMNGTLNIRSNHSSGGTEINIEIPLTEEA